VAPERRKQRVDHKKNPRGIPQGLESIKQQVQLLDIGGGNRLLEGVDETALALGRANLAGSTYCLTE
jgi:hypothetical protein